MQANAFIGRIMQDESLVYAGVKLGSAPRSYHQSIYMYSIYMYRGNHLRSCLLKCID